MGAAIAWLTIRPKPLHTTVTPAIYRMPFERIRFRSSDNTPLAGWLIPASGKSKGVIILCHGIDSERTAMLADAQVLHRHGYATLLFDFRARGESGGSRCTLGFREVDDLLAAIEFVRARADCRSLPLGVLGESLGGSVALMGTSRCADVKAVVAESPFARMDHAVRNHFADLFGGAAPAIALPVQWMGELMIGHSCSDISPVAEIGKIAPRPIFLIQDGDDALCPPAETRDLMAAAMGPKELWSVPGAGHIEAEVKESKEWERRVVGFYDRAFYGAPSDKRTKPAGSPDRESATRSPKP